MAKKMPTQLYAVEFQLEKVMNEIQKLATEVEALRKELEDVGRGGAHRGAKRSRSS
ncbi:MAG: hypothetical protein H5U05_10810 [Candidatus Aminicenantes bacterium]|nr:hypothetical protein [Candidatus Aminicenantes bacterium]